MSVEVDQSGKIEQLNTNTVIALANDFSIAVYIPAASKQKLFLKLRQIKLFRDILYPNIFAVLIFMAMKHLKKLPEIMYIDEEYTGKDKLIHYKLMMLIRKFKPKWNGSIRFKRVGKQSPAHKLAWLVHAKKGRINCIKTNDLEILRLLE